MPYIPTPYGKQQAAQTREQNLRQELDRLEKLAAVEQARQAADKAATEASAKEVYKYLKAAIKDSIAIGSFNDLTVREYLSRSEDSEFALMALCRDLLFDVYFNATKVDTGFAFNGCIYSSASALESAVAELLRVPSIPFFREILRGHLKGSGNDLIDRDLKVLQIPKRDAYDKALLNGLDAALMSLL